MKIGKKALVLSLCLAALAVGSTVGTMAYLNDDDADVNTFVVGNVGLTLDEADVNPDGSLASEKRVQGNEYHLIPGHTYIKDPTVTVNAGSANAYVRMIVKVEGLNSLKDAIPNEDTTARFYSTYGTEDIFLLQELCRDGQGDVTWDSELWQFEKYTESADGTTGIYEFRYKELVETSETATELPDLFTHFTVPGEVDNADLEEMEKVNIIVNAQAIQADGFRTADDAWSMFESQI